MLFMHIVDHALQQLSQTSSLTLEQMLENMPELAATLYDRDVLRLLLRLDRRLQVSSDGKWSLVLTALTPERRIIASAQAFLTKIPGGGARLSSVVEHVAADTHFDRDLIRSVISQHFVSTKTLVRNQLKENL
jgi:hypothetical protein